MSVEDAKYLERVNGSNTSHLAVKLMMTPKNIKTLQPLALTRMGKDVDLRPEPRHRGTFFA